MMNVNVRCQCRTSLNLLFSSPLINPLFLLFLFLISFSMHSRCCLIANVFKSDVFNLISSQCYQPPPCPLRLTIEHSYNLFQVPPHSPTLSPLTLKPPILLLASFSISFHPYPPSSLKFLPEIYPSNAVQVFPAIVLPRPDI